MGGIHPFQGQKRGFHFLFHFSLPFSDQNYLLNMVFSKSNAPVYDQKLNYKLRVPKSEKTALSLIPSHHPPLQIPTSTLPIIMWGLL